MNKPFTLALSVPHDVELSAVFPPIVVGTRIFPVDRDNDGTHTFIVNKITDMTSDAMKSLFTMTSEIHDAIRRLVEKCCKWDATGKECFRFLTSRRPNNSNVQCPVSARMTGHPVNFNGHETDGARFKGDCQSPGI